MSTIDSFLLEKIWNDPFWREGPGKITAKEGFTARYPEKSLALFQIASKLDEGCKIAEVGFNVGHGAHTLIKGASKISKFVSFDICSHDYVKNSWKFFTDRFEFFETHQGDSLVVFRDFSDKNQNSFDLVHVDGCHTFEIALSDIESAFKLAKTGGIVIVDDFNIEEIQRAFSLIDKSLYEILEKVESIAGGSQCDIRENRRSSSLVLKKV